MRALEGVRCDESVTDSLIVDRIVIYNQVLKKYGSTRERQLILLLHTFGPDIALIQYDG